MLTAIRLLERLLRALGCLSALLLLLLLLNIFYDVIMRYLFNDVSIAMQELEWHLYASLFLLGVSYTVISDGHVRVDVFYERFGPRQKAWVNLLGSVFFLLPFALLVTFYGIGFVYESWLLGEQSGDPGGLPFRWLIKAIIPLSFFCLTASGIVLLLRSLHTLTSAPK